MAYLKNMLNKIIIHQQLFILSLLGFIFLNTLIPADLVNPDYLIWTALFLVSSIGVSHGALDGKLIWYGINKNIQRFTLFIFYLLFVLSGWLLWISFPVIGLTLLLIMAVFHFGNADLRFLKLADINIKLSWGFTMTFLPILFKKDVVLSIFYNLINTKISETLIVIIYCILILSIVRIYWFFVTNFLNSKEISVWYEDKNILLLSEFTLLILLSYLVHPFIWFAIYFCGLHGLRSLIDSKFMWRIDLKWIMIFTLPVLIFIYFTHGKYWNSDNYSIIFPILGALTIAHMSLPTLINHIKKLAYD